MTWLLKPMKKIIVRIIGALAVALVVHSAAASADTITVGELRSDVFDLCLVTYGASVEGLPNKTGTWTAESACRNLFTAGVGASR